MIIEGTRDIHTYIPRDFEDMDGWIGSVVGKEFDLMRDEIQRKGK